MAVSRSDNMRRIRSKNTSLELLVRRTLRDIGFSGYRLHRKELPGKPDIAFIGRKKAIIVHGCFWHGHDCKEGLRKPKSNRNYWLPKIEGNRQRDERHCASLSERGWDVLTVWECEVRDSSTLAVKLESFLKSSISPAPASSRGSKH